MKLTERCPLCPSRNTNDKPVVSGDWCVPYDGQKLIAFIGEAPGREENNRQRVFVGKAGAEFNNTYLPLAGLDRNHVSMTNSCKCHWADSSDAPPDALVKSCSEFHLRRELAHYRPDFVVLMGATANSLMGLDVEMEHGMLHQGELLGYKGPIFSTFHPALGLHKSDKMLAMIDRLDGDFPRLKLALDGRLKVLHDDCTTEFTRLSSARRVRSVLRKALHDDCSIAVDTESKKSWRGYPSTVKYTPWCATFAMWTGEAFMVRVGDEAFEEFGRLINSFWRIIFHNMPYDHEILRLAGILVDWDRGKDTMQMAYDEGRLPKGLKALSYRLLGKRMRSFDDVVIPHSRSYAIDYLQEATMHKWPAPVQEATGEMVERNCSECKGKGKIWNGVRGKFSRYYPCDCAAGKVTVPKMTRKQSIVEKLNRLSTDLVSKGGAVDIWKRWEGWTESDPLGMKSMIDQLGPIPIPSIEYVPDDEAIEYACSDAHETLRIFPLIQERLVDIRQRVRT